MAATTHYNAIYSAAAQAREGSKAIRQVCEDAIMDFKSNTVRGEAKFRQFAYEVSLSLIRLNPSRWQVMGREYRYIYELVSGLVYQEKMGRPTIRLPIRPAGDDQTSVGVDRLIEFLHDVPILIASM